MCVLNEKWLLRYAIVRSMTSSITVNGATGVCVSLFSSRLAYQQIHLEGGRPQHTATEK